MLSGLFLSLAFLSISGPAAAAGAPTALSFGAQVVKHSANTSIDWSGYAVATNLASPESNAVSDVRAQWRVPAVSQTVGGYSAVWVGIDGYSDNTVEQIGTEQDWVGGVPTYFAWYEMAPKQPRTIGRVYPGDLISADVSYVGASEFKLTLTDTTAGHAFKFTTTQEMSALRQSAEWSVEAPSSPYGVLPLADFATVSFTGAKATLDGHTGTISDAAWQNDLITMASRRGAVEALPSALSANGSSFSVTWENPPSLQGNGLGRGRAWGRVPLL